MKFYVLRDYPSVVVDLKTISPSLEYIKEEGGTLKYSAALARLEDIAVSDLVRSNGQPLPRRHTRQLLPTSGKWEPSGAISAS
jgi:hypothetical protein